MYAIQKNGVIELGIFNIRIRYDADSFSLLQLNILVIQPFCLFKTPEGDFLYSLGVQVPTGALFI